MSSQDYKYLFKYLQNGNNKDLHNIQSLLKSARVDINIDNGKLLLMGFRIWNIRNDRIITPVWFKNKTRN